MRTHRFVGATSREVLHKVKQALGDDAMILSNRPHGDGIEVIALSASEAQRHDDDFEDFSVTLSSAPRREPEAAATVREAAPAPAPVAAAPAPVAAPVAAAVAAAPTAAVAAAAPAAVAPVIAPAAAAVIAPAAAAAIAPVVATAGVASSMVASTMMAAPGIAQRATFVPAVAAPAQAPAAQPTASWAGSITPAPAPAIAPAFTAPQASAAPAAAPALDGILNEIQTLKATLQRDIAALAAFDTSTVGVGRTGVMHELLNAGFSAKLAREVAEEVCEHEIDPTIDQLGEAIQRRITLAENDEIVNRGGVYALVGPTGVGKTTTIAKLAARAVVRFGASKVALLTTDSYRIGGHDQLRTYGRILNVPVHSVRDAADLAHVLAELKDRHLILIDTIGMSQRDRMLAEQASMLAGCGDVKRLLLIQTTANARTLQQVVTAYRQAGIEGCILTKTDEAASLAPALDVAIRHELPLHYVTDGQRVPEDLQLPDAAALVREALNPAHDEAFDLTAEEMPFVLPAMLRQPTAEAAHV